jgi:hypothetical protein
MTAAPRPDRLDAARQGVLDRMERADRHVRNAILAAGAAELGLFAVAFTMLDWQSRVERLMFVLAVLTYTILALGLVALGAHVSRCATRVVAALGGEEPG